MAAGRPAKRWISVKAKQLIADAKQLRHAAGLHAAQAKGAAAFHEITRAHSPLVIGNAARINGETTSATKAVSNALKKSRKDALRHSGKALALRAGAQENLAAANRLVRKQNPLSKTRGRNRRDLQF